MMDHPHGRAQDCAQLMVSVPAALGPHWTGRRVQYGSWSDQNRHHVQPCLAQGMYCGFLNGWSRCHAIHNACPSQTTTCYACSSQYRTHTAHNAWEHHMWCGSWTDWNGHSPARADTLHASQCSLQLLQDPCYMPLAGLHCTAHSTHFPCSGIHGACSVDPRPVGAGLGSNMLGEAGGPWVWFSPWTNPTPLIQLVGLSDSGTPALQRRKRDHLLKLETVPLASDDRL